MGSIDGLIDDISKEVKQGTGTVGQEYQKVEGKLNDGVRSINDSITNGIKNGIKDEKIKSGLRSISDSLEKGFKQVEDELNKPKVKNSIDNIANAINKSCNQLGEQVQKDINEFKSNSTNKNE